MITSVTANCRQIVQVIVVATMMIVFSARVSAEEEPFKGYQELCGYPLVYIPNLTISQAVIEPNGEKVIVLDPSLTAPLESPRRQFLIAHECAHHRMDHAGIASRQARLRSAKVVRDQELSADCWAAETLAVLGLDRPIQIMADRFYKAGLYSPGGGYPAGIQRSTIIIHCAETGRKAGLRDRSNGVN